MTDSHSVAQCTHAELQSDRGKTAIEPESFHFLLSELLVEVEVLVIMRTVERLTKMV